MNKLMSSLFIMFDRVLSLIKHSIFSCRLFWDLPLEERVTYMIYWCDPDKREAGFRKADAILLELFEGFEPEKERKIDFTPVEESLWERFLSNKGKERVA